MITQKLFNKQQILFDANNFTSISCIVSKDSGYWEIQGDRKIVGAGSPIQVDLFNRNVPAISNPYNENCVVLLHDVDITDSDQNAQALVFGSVNFTKLSDNSKVLANIFRMLTDRIVFIQ
jgi:hypothetical protein